MDDVGNPAQLEARIEGSASEEGGSFGGIFAGRVDFTGPVVIVVFDKPHLRRRSEVNRSHAAGGFGGVAADIDFKGVQYGPHLLTSWNGAVKRGSHADLMAEGGEVFRQGGRSVP